MKKLLLIALLVILVSGISWMRAAEPQAGERIEISNPQNDDLYLAGQEIAISALINGDLTAAGPSIIVSDSINGDLLLAGGDILITGYIADDIRVFGGTLNIQGSCGGDLIIIGGTVNIHSTANVMGDVIAMGGEIDILGNIEGKLKTYGGKINLGGRVNKDAEIKGGELYINGVVAGNAIIAAEKLSLGSQARLENQVRYWTEGGEMSFDNAASHAQFDPALGEGFEDETWGGAGFIFFLIFSLFASLLLSTLLVFVFGRYFSRGSHHFQSDFFKNFGFGILYILGIPVLIALLMVTIIGIPMGLLFLGLYLFTLVFAPTFAAVLITYWLRWRNKKEWGNWLLVLISGRIFLAFCLILFTPFVGWLIGVFVVGASFGAILSGSFQRRITSAVL